MGENASPSFSKARAKIYLLPTFAHFGILDQGPVSLKKKIVYAEKLLFFVINFALPKLENGTKPFKLR